MKQFQPSESLAVGFLLAQRAALLACVPLLAVFFLLLRGEKECGA